MLNMVKKAKELNNMFGEFLDRKIEKMEIEKRYNEASKFLTLANIHGWRGPEVNDAIEEMKTCEALLETM